MELALAENVDWDFDSDAPASGEFSKTLSKNGSAKLVPEQLQHELEHRQVHSTQRKRTPLGPGEKPFIHTPATSVRTSASSSNHTSEKTTSPKSPPWDENAHHHRVNATGSIL